MTPPVLNTIGLVLTILGVLGLFRFGMPFHVPTGGTTYLSLSEQSHDDVDRERRYGVFATISLAMVLAGAGFQIWATWAAPA